MLAASTRCCNGYGLLGWSTVLLAVPDDALSALILLMNWCFTKMAGREIIIICTLSFIMRPYYLQNISKLVDECWRYSKPKQCRFRAWLKRPNFRDSRSQGSAETLVRRGGITNHHSIAYSLSNISAKITKIGWCVDVIVCHVSFVFWDTVYNGILLHICLILHVVKYKFHAVSRWH